MSHAQAQNPSAFSRQAVAPQHEQQSPLKEFLAFRHMITPTIVQIVFWIGVVSTVLVGLFMLKGGEMLAGLGTLIGGPLVVRMYCELMILGFRNYDRVKAIAENTRR